MGDFDPSATLGPDDPLRAWLQDPSMAEFVKQKAVEHAGNVLGFSDPYGNNINPESGMPDNGPRMAPKVPLPAPRPIEADPYIMDKGPATGVTPKGSTPPFDDRYPPANAFDPAPAAGVPLPAPRPASAGPGASDVSAKKKGDLEGATNDFAKMMAGIKAIQPPPVSPVGTPNPPHTGHIQAAQVNQLLQLMGAQSRPDPVQTLGRLLVSGKA